MAQMDVILLTLLFKFDYTGEVQTINLLRAFLPLLTLDLLVRVV